MGQYHVIVNLTRKEFIDPSYLEGGLKLVEICSTAFHASAALVLLLAQDNGQGGGDFNSRTRYMAEISGRWSGDKITVAGDYGEIIENGRNLYDLCGMGEYLDITEIAFRALASNYQIDEYMRKRLYNKDKMPKWLEPKEVTEDKKG